MKRGLLNIFILSICLLISIFLLYFLNYSILEQFIIGDEHKYIVGNSEPNFIFNLFYEISSDTGYHPEPSYFNFVFTFILGCSLGLLFFYKVIRRTRK